MRLDKQRVSAASSPRQEANVRTGKRMSSRALYRKLGVSVIPGRVVTWGGTVLFGRGSYRCEPGQLRRRGNEPQGIAWLVAPTVVAYDADAYDAEQEPAALGHPDIFHEVMHAVCGPESLDEEGPLMAVQWACMNLLVDAERGPLRKDFSNYGVSQYGEVGDSDTFVKRQCWLGSCVAPAKERGFLTATGAPNWRVLRDPTKWRRGRRASA